MKLVILDKVIEQFMEKKVLYLLALANHEESLAADYLSSMRDIGMKTMERAESKFKSQFTKNQDKDYVHN